MKTLYVADLDGTIARDDETISEYTKTTINALIKHGLSFTLNTSRTPQSAKPVIEGLKLKLPAILMNGSGIFNMEKWEMESLSVISEMLSRNVLNVLKRLNQEPFVFTFNDNDVDVEYSSANSIYARRFMDERKGYYKEIKKVSYFKNLGKTLYIVCPGEKEPLSAAAKEIEKINGLSCGLFISNEKMCYLEIYSKDAGKWNGLQKFKKDYGFDRIVAFGDNLNDIDMLKNSDIGVCVANGYKEAKDASDVVIGCCEEDAVAKYLLEDWAKNLELY